MRLFHFVAFALFSCVTTVSLLDCESIASRVRFDPSRVVHRGKQREVFDATIHLARNTTLPAVVKRLSSNQHETDPANLFRAEMRNFALFPATAVMKLHGSCFTAPNGPVVVAEKLLGFHALLECAPLLHVATRLSLAIQTLGLVDLLIQRQLLACDWHRGQLGVRVLHDADHAVVFIDVDSLQSAAGLLDGTGRVYQLGDENHGEATLRGVKTCHTDADCATVPCVANHHPYADARCVLDASARRGGVCGALSPAAAMIQVLNTNVSAADAIATQGSAHLVAPLLLANHTSRLTKNVAKALQLELSRSDTDATHPTAARRVVQGMQQSAATRWSLAQVLEALQQMLHAQTKQLARDRHRFGRDRQVLLQCLRDDTLLSVERCKTHRFC